MERAWGEAWGGRAWRGPGASGGASLEQPPAPARGEQSNKPSRGGCGPSPVPSRAPPQKMLREISGPDGPASLAMDTRRQKQAASSHACCKHGRGTLASGLCELEAPTPPPSGRPTTSDASARTCQQAQAPVVPALARTRARTRTRAAAVNRGMAPKPRSQALDGAWLPPAASSDATAQSPPSLQPSMAGAGHFPPRGAGLPGRRGPSVSARQKGRQG